MRRQIWEIQSLAKEKYLSTLCDVVEIHSKALKETNVRDPESLAKEKYLSTVCDVVEISSNALKKTIVRVLEFLSQETSLRSRRLKQKFPFNLKVTLFLSKRNIWNGKEISFLFCFSSLWLASMSFIYTISIKDNTCIVIFEVVLCRQCFIAQWCNRGNHNLYLLTCKNGLFKTKF